ncbi:MAG TPA: SDR family oxidoreductase [Nitrosomonas sp.]|nr:SDR family oxidoreductase [Nitrosomonas sp.]HQX13043.1 SDR family oxidoreductase [Nitrosomonas sp.]HRB20437.1 SDR family oxidoreductase [Nitrosomonas sp.]HRB32767.1 SDR family oxidoreductase [Nitrosomonas sp.]HRB45166.1 SDR family oxidoreductase [Nitrosomonas sp.]
MSVFNRDSFNQNTFLITGGAGFIGSHIVEFLLKNNAKKVRVLDNLSTGLQQNVDLFLHHPAYEFINGDIRDFSACQKACEGMDYVSHQAALGSVPRSIKDPLTTNEVNITGFVNMITAAKESGIKTFVYASSSSVYGSEPTLPKIENRVGDPLSPYAVTKKANELYASVFHDLYGMKVIGFRYFNVFGPRQDPNGPYAAVIPLFVKGILNNTPVYINGDGEQTRDFTFIDNAVQANIRGLFCENEQAFGKVINVAVGEKFTVNFMYSAIKEMLQSEHEAIYREPRAGDIRNSLADISLAHTLIGYTPTHQFMDGLKETVKFFVGIYK